MEGAGCDGRDVRAVAVVVGAVRGGGDEIGAPDGAGLGLGGGVGVVGGAEVGVGEADARVEDVDADGGAGGGGVGVGLWERVVAVGDAG